MTNSELEYRLRDSRRVSDWPREVSASSALYVCMTSALDATMSASSRSPEARRTPVARSVPPSAVAVSIAATGLERRTVPPSSSKSRTMPATRAPVPPCANHTPQRRSSAWISP